jgi:hypothetical protein
LASQTRLVVDSATSTLEIELCVQGTCDTEISALRGFLTVALDNDTNPTQISLRNFDLQATRDYNFHLDYGFLGDIFATGRTLRVYHAFPGPQQSFFPIVAGQYTLLNAPYLLTGTADYQASGFMCTFIEGNGTPCIGTIDLSQQSSNTIAELSGTVQISEGFTRVNVTFTFISPLDPDNLSLGTITGRAVINAFAPRIDIERSGDNHVLRWPSAAVGFRLQFSPTLGPSANWQNQSGTATNDGAWQILSLPSAEAGRFYRLSQ